MHNWLFIRLLSMWYYVREPPHIWSPNWMQFRNQSDTGQLTSSVSVHHFLIHWWQIWQQQLCGIFARIQEDHTLLACLNLAPPFSLCVHVCVCVIIIESKNCSDAWFILVPILSLLVPINFSEDHGISKLSEDFNRTINLQWKKRNPTNPISSKSVFRKVQYEPGGYGACL